MTRKTKTLKMLGYIFVLFGMIMVIGTIGHSDWQDLTPGVRPEEILPFWRLVFQTGIGMVMFFLGAWLADLFKQFEQSKE